MQTNVLARVQEGMKVFDVETHEIGKVAWVRLGEDDPSTPEIESASPAVEVEDSSLIDDIAQAFRPDELPEEMRERLLEDGFVRLEGGLLSGDRYILPDQISAVSDEGLILNVDKNELLKH
jgi:hypothetical protein